MRRTIGYFHKRFGWLARCASLALLAPVTAGAAEFSLSIADIAAPDFSARGITLVLPESGSADLRVAELNVRQHGLRNVHIHCAKFAFSTATISCHGGRLPRLPGVTMELDYRFDTGSWEISAQLNNVPGKQFAALLSADMPLPTQGKLDGSLSISGDASGIAAIDVGIQMTDVGFSDTSGLHAAEKLNGTIKFSAAKLPAAGKETVLAWQGNVEWQSGEIFWEPLYLSGKHRVSASGSLDGASLKIEQAVVDLPEAGRMQFTAIWDIKQSALVECTAHGGNLALEKLFADYAKPFLGKGSLAESSLYGHADVDWQYRNGATQSLRMILRDAGIADTERRFALLGVNSEIDWQADAPRTASIAFAGGALLGMPLGSGKWAVQMSGMEFGMAQGVLPVLDGKLELRDFRLYRKDDAWRWQFGASLGEISMEQFSRAAGWPNMLGTLSGSIPKVGYDGKEISVEGALLFNVLDGTVAATQLKLADPFGRAPRLSGNLSMRELDLDLLTRTFSFGSMQGRIDVDVNNLELQDWQPARFDARLSSSAGNYPKKISQKAVQNISALGGAGAAAAIQRSYLRFFENFGYDRIGWSCKLRNGVCAMGGVEDGSGGAYAIVKGGGIPAITVMGYNRDVGWNELLTRLKRVTQGNIQAVVK